MKEPKREAGLGKTALVIASAGTLLAAYIIIGIFAARWLQRMIDGPEFWVAIGAISGMALGIINVALLIKKFLGEQNG
ncbi:MULTISPECIES: ATPase F0F1 [Paenibacillus]|uniref:ATPase F0F1 n=1 Tax=Paenibacillus TaxID=44249 RepID=UPI0004F6B5B1|nr:MULTISPECIES: ATPase F0F1 [Paenibacillus]AIQ55195.1 ATPase F0F1 [Paenibacillus sp. FSL R7-0331]